MKKKAKKYSDEKAKVSLLPLIAMDYLMEVGKMGAKKYGDNNYRIGRPVTDWTDAAYRHVFGKKGFVVGIDEDEESQLPHLAHAAWNLLVALEQQLLKPEFDNRVYKKKK